MTDVVSEFTISVQQREDYEFLVTFDRPATALLTDEPPPLGRSEGPSPSRLLAAAVGNCLAASLLFCARKARVGVRDIRAEVKTQTVRNEQKRLRIGRIDVTIDPHFVEEDRANAARCLSLFEDYCTVTQSVRSGIDIHVHVKGFEEMERGGARPAS